MNEYPDFSGRGNLWITTDVRKKDTQFSSYELAQMGKHIVFLDDLYRQYPAVPRSIIFDAAADDFMCSL